MNGNPNKVNQNPRRMNWNPLGQKGKKLELRAEGPKKPKRRDVKDHKGRQVRNTAAKPKYAPAAQNRGVEEKKLSSRKIVWLEKIKLHLGIFACNARLKLGFYNSPLERQALKQSIDEYQEDLKILKSDAALKESKERFNEAIQDDRVKEAFRAGVDVAKVYAERVKIFWG